MKLLKKIDRFITDKTYKIIIKNNNINIINYKKILDFSNNKIVIENNNNTTTILGEELVVSKMQDNEVLITGKIKKVEL